MHVFIASSINCGELSNITNGEIFVTSVTYGGRATYTCDSRFAVNGSKERACQADGTWSGTEPHCDGK